MDNQVQPSLSNLSLDKLDGKDNQFPVPLHAENPVLKFPYFVEEDKDKDEDEDVANSALIYLGSICLSLATLLSFVAALIYVTHSTPASYLHLLWPIIPAGLAFLGFRWSNKQDVIIANRYEEQKKIHQEKVEQFNAGLKSLSRVILVKNLQRPGQSAELKKVVEEELFERWIALDQQQAKLWPNFDEYKTSIVERS